MLSIRIASCAAALAATTALATAADSVAAGYHLDSTIEIPMYASFTALPRGGLLLFDGIDVRGLFPPSKLSSFIGSTPSFVYPSFVLVHPTQGFAILGESSHGQVFRTDFGTEELASLAQVPLNFDAAWEDSGHFLLSASPCMLNCGTDILRVDASSGGRSIVAHVPGPSGPLALSAAGDLYYGRQATTYPPPAGSLYVLRWSSARLAEGIVLDESDADVVVAGFDGIGSIDIDPVRGHLWVAESRWPGGSEILEYRLDGHPLGTVVTSSNWIANVEVTAVSPHAGSGRVHRYGAPIALRYASVDYNPPGRSELVTVLSTPITVPPAHR